jgi:hypothetical protein
MLSASLKYVKHKRSNHVVHSNIGGRAGTEASVRSALELSVSATKSGRRAEDLEELTQTGAKLAPVTEIFTV